jgi:uncharacterized membrane protein
MEILDPPGASHRNIEEIARNNYEFRFGDYINKAIILLRKNPGLFFAYGFVGTILMGIPFINYMAMAGFFIAARKTSRGEQVLFDDFFAGFKEPVVVPLLIAGIVVPIVTALGIVLCILPGIYLAVGYLFVVPMILWETKDFWQAMEASRKVITRQWFMFLLFIIVAGFLSQLGFILCGIGVFLTIPIVYLSIYCAFEDIVGFRD